MLDIVILDSFGAEPRYPFGYGLSYTDFSVEKEQVNVLQADGTAEVQVRVKSDQYRKPFPPGKRSGSALCKLPRQNGGSRKNISSWLHSARRKSWHRGEDTEMLLAFDLRDLAYFREEDASYVLDAGDYVLRLGTSSRDTRPAAVLYAGSGHCDRGLPVCV